MKIAILGTRGIPARYGGFETFAERLSLGLSARGIDVTVFCDARPEGAPSDWNGVTLRYAPVKFGGPLQTVFYDLRCLWAARRGFDIVYMLGYGASPFCRIPALWGTTVWINPDGVEWARAKWNRIAKLYFRMMEWISVRTATRIIADSSAIAHHLTNRQHTNFACSVVAYGCDPIRTAPPTDPLARWQLSPGEYYLVVCRLEPENHVLEILRAFQATRSARQLIVLGNLADNAYVRALRSVQDERIRLIGTVYEQDQLTALRYYCAAYMHGHSVGGTNPSLLEAMGCRNLVLAHDNPFNRETLADCGLFFTSVADLTALIQQVEEESAESLNRQRDGCLERAERVYSWDGIISRYCELIADVAGKR